MRTAECDKSTVTCNVSIVQCEDSTIKCNVLVTWYNRLPTSENHSQNRVPQNSSNHSGKKGIKGNTKCDKSIITCDVGTAQCKDGTIKYEEKK